MAPAISGTPNVGDTLSCSTGTWTNSPTRFSYQWYRNGSTISGAAARTYTVQIGDGAQTLTCAVTASNAAGSSSPATSPSLLVAVKGTLTCPKPSGRLNGSKLGPLALGMTRSKANKRLSRYTLIGFGFQDHCLYAGFGIRVNYPSKKLLRTLSHRESKRVAGRIVIALTANPYYNLEGVQPGASVAAVAHRLKLGKQFHVGANTWYLAPGKTSNGVLKVRNGQIIEIGIANKQLTTGRKAQLRFLTSFS